MKARILPMALIAMALMATTVFAESVTIYDNRDASVYNDPYCHTDWKGEIVSCVRDQTGNVNILDVQSLNDVERTYVGFSRDSMPDGLTISSAQFCIFCTGYSGYFEDITYNLHHVLSNWHETNITWNNQPCGDIPVSNPLQCDLTPKTIQVPPSGWVCTDVTEWITGDYSLGRDTSFMIGDSQENGTERRSRHFSPKEDNYNPGMQPYIEITYSGTPTTTTTIPTTTTTVLPSTIFIDVGTTMTLPQVTSTMEIDTDYTDNSVTYLYGTYNVDGVTEALHQLNSETYPNPAVIHTFNNVGNFDYTATIMYTLATYDGSSWIIADQGVDSQITQKYIVTEPPPPPTPEPPADFIASILSTLQSLFCTVLPFLCV